MTQAKKAIYALVDPLTGADRYVGCTRDDPEKRLRDHVAEALHVLRRKGPEALTEKHVWICDLLRLDKHPTVRVIEWVAREYAPAREVFWILNLRREGANLCNVQDQAPALPKPSGALQRAEAEWASRSVPRAARTRVQKKKKPVPVQNQGGIALAMALDALGVSDIIAADSIDMSRGYVGLAIKGASIPKYRTRMRIEALYGVPAALWDMVPGVPSDEVSP